MQKLHKVQQKWETTVGKWQSIVIDTKWHKVYDLNECKDIEFKSKNEEKEREKTMNFEKNLNYDTPKQAVPLCYKFFGCKKNDQILIKKS